MGPRCLRRMGREFCGRAVVVRVPRVLLVGQLVEGEKEEWRGGRRFLLVCELTGWPIDRGKVGGEVRLRRLFVRAASSSERRAWWILVAWRRVMLSCSAC